MFLTTARFKTSPSLFMLNIRLFSAQRDVFSLNKKKKSTFDFSTKNINKMKSFKSILIFILVVAAFISCNNTATKQDTSSQNVTVSADSAKTMAETNMAKDSAKEEILSLTAMFVDFTLGDAEHYAFKDKAGKSWDFGGCEEENIKFAVELPEAQANEDNRGFGSNKALQKKWFDLKYVIRNQPQYQDGPMAKVPVIVAATMK